MNNTKYKPCAYCGKHIHEHDDIWLQHDMDLYRDDYVDGGTMPVPEVFCSQECAIADLSERVTRLDNSKGIWSRYFFWYNEG